ncbi:hypothetical protein [Clostridium sp. UBA6640]|uniref:hypothetical protein n=1 Tax=Clostridium sp. UBA6640 TaxID=1946370 RepID=UPI0025BE7EF8|nr:hypothetical protein [Clostridium sp. UBA6640]
MDIRKNLSKTTRKKIVSLAMPGGLALSILIGSTVPVNATVVNQGSIVNSAMIQSTSVGIGKVSDRINIGRTETLVVENQLIDDKILDDDINKAIDINFTPNISANDLRIESWKMYNNGSEVEFFITYESDIDRYVSFFNSPNGNIFMKNSGAKLSAGKNNLKIKIPVSQYNNVKDSITMKFWETESDRNFIWFNSNQLIDDSILDSDINKAVDITFTPNISANNLKVESCKMYNNGSEVEFFVTYESGIDRYVSFFNPPNGDIFMKTSGMKLSAGKNNLKFKIPVEQYNSSKGRITMKFWESEDDRNFIWFNLDQKIVTNQLIDDSILDSDMNKAVDVTFASDILANDLKIESWKMYNNGNEVEFFVTYESGIDRYVSFFNPPNGDVFMKTSGTRLSAGKNHLKFKIPVEQYNSVEDGITMKFWEAESDRNFIWFDK